MAKKKYYAISKGKKPGIYTNWPEAQAQVAGFTGAVFKGFPTLEEAKDWLKKPTYGSQVKAKKTSKPKTSKDTSPKDTSPKDGEVTIYTDGGSINNPGPGGYGVVQVYGDQRKELSGGFRKTTNNRMELMGVIVALRELEYRDIPVAIYSDSSYVVNGITKGWAIGWRKRGWIKADKKPAVNPDLWEELLDLVDGLNIRFNWVKGHAGNPLNERCDELVGIAARQDDLPVDEGYEST